MSAKLPTILLIEDTEEVREILLMILRSQVKANIVEANSYKKASELIQSLPEIDCIFSDYDLGDGISYDVYQAMKKRGLKIPFILCSGTRYSEMKFTDQDTLSARIEKPFKSETVIEAMRVALSKFSTPPTKQDQPDYCPVRLETLLKMREYRSDLYLQLSPGTYVKLRHASEPFNEEELQKLKQKHVESLFVESKNIGQFLNSYAQDVLTMSRAESLDTKSASSMASEAYKTLHGVVNQLGVTPEAVELAKSCSTLALASILNEPGLTLSWAKEQFHKDQYLSAHSTVLAQLSCLVASMLGIQSKSIQYKLAFASLIHDLALPDDAVAAGELRAWMDHDAFLDNAKKNKLMWEHTDRAGELLSKMEFVPTDVDLIVKTHHERPGGDGFPHQTTWKDLSPIQSIFIIAHDLANYIWLQDQELSMASFVESQRPEYAEGIFKTFIESAAKTGNSQKV